MTAAASGRAAAEALSRSAMFSGPSTTSLLRGGRFTAGATVGDQHCRQPGEQCDPPDKGQKTAHVLAVVMAELQQHFESVERRSPAPVEEYPARQATTDHHARCGRHPCPQG